jgi:hypothetical protein
MKTALSPAMNSANGDRLDIVWPPSQSRAPVRTVIQGIWNIKLTVRIQKVSFESSESNILLFYAANVGAGRSRWPRGLRHEPSSPAQTLVRWVRTPLEAWIYMRLFCICAVLCAGSGRGLIPGRIRIFLVSITSRLNLEATQSPIQWVLGVKRQEREGDSSPPFMARLSFNSLHVFMVRWLIN